MKIKNLLVLVQNKDDHLLGRAHDGLVTERAVLMRELRLPKLSVLRGDLNFCIETLKTIRSHPVIVILEHNVYANAETRNSVFNAGAAQVYTFLGTNENDLVTRFGECVRHFVTSR